VRHGTSVPTSAAATAPSTPVVATSVVAVPRARGSTSSPTSVSAAPSSPASPNPATKRHSTYCGSEVAVALASVASEYSTMEPYSTERRPRRSPSIPHSTPPSIIPSSCVFCSSAPASSAAGPSAIPTPRTLATRTTANSSRSKMSTKYPSPASTMGPRAWRRGTRSGGGVTKKMVTRDARTAAGRRTRAPDASSPSPHPRNRARSSPDGSRNCTLPAQRPQSPPYGRTGEAEAGGIPGVYCQPGGGPITAAPVSPLAGAV